MTKKTNETEAIRSTRLLGTDGDRPGNDAFISNLLTDTMWRVAFIAFEGPLILTRHNHPDNN